LGTLIFESATIVKFSLNAILLQSARRFFVYMYRKFTLWI